MMKNHLHNLLLASALACASCKHPAPELGRQPVGSDGQSGMRGLSADNEIAGEVRKRFGPLLQRSFPGWVKTEPLVFDELFWELHADQAEQWRSLLPAEEGWGTFDAAWQEDLAVFQRIFPRNGTGYGLAVDTSGSTPLIAWSHGLVPPPQAELPFEVEFRNPKYRFGSDFRPPPGPSLQVSDGWLVCHDHGEFGGWLYWYSEDGEKSYEVAEGAWVNSFFRFGGRLFAASGLSHLSADSGTVFELAKVGGRWQAVKAIQLAQEAHLAAPMTDTSFVVVCTATLAEVSLDGSVRYLYGVVNVDMLGGDIWGRKASWMCYGPSSVVVHAGKVWIGTTFGVVVVTLRGWDSTEQWLVPGEQYAHIAEHFKLFPELRIPGVASQQPEKEPANEQVHGTANGSP